MSQLQVGDTLPDVSLYSLSDGRPKAINLAELSRNKRLVLFAVPGAFTPTCSARHLPEFEQQATAIKAFGIDEIICLSVNDAWVMQAWGEQLGVKQVRLLGDGNGQYSQATQLTLDRQATGMGTRALRHAMIVDDQRVSWLALDPSGLEHSSAEAVLKQLAAMS